MPSDQLFSKMFIHSILYMEYFINNSTYKQYNIIYNYVLFTIYFTFFKKKQDFILSNKAYLAKG